MIFIDSKILIDIVSGNPDWLDWSINALAEARSRGRCIINAAVFQEFAFGFATLTECEAELDILDLSYAEIGKAAAFGAAQAFVRYKRAGGTRTNVLSDFLIGAQADHLGIPILTRDIKRYRTYFPAVRLIAPESA